MQRLAQKGEALRAATAGAYDLVSLDPRGIGSSTRANCRIPEADRHLMTLRSWPAPDGSIAANTERSRRTAEALRPQRRTGAALLHHGERGP